MQTLRVYLLLLGGVSSQENLWVQNLAEFIPEVYPLLFRICIEINSFADEPLPRACSFD